MQIVESEAIVLRTLKYGETSVIAELYTQSHGLKSCIVNGIRSTKNKSGSSAFQVMNMLEIAFYNKEGDALCRTKEYHYAVKYHHLGSDVIRTSVGVFLVECVRNAILEKEENPALFAFLKSRFIALDQSPVGQLTEFYLRFLVELSTYLGFAPLNNFDADLLPCFHLIHGKFEASHKDPAYLMDEGPSRILHFILGHDTGSLPGSKVEKDQLTDDLLRYFACHLEGFRPIRSLEVLRTIMR